MKRKIFISLLMSFAIVSILSAQDKDSSRKEEFAKLRAKKVAFITERVQFTPAEAEAFWPLSNELQEKKFQLYKTMRDIRRNARESKKELTEADYAKIIDEYADIKIKEAQLDKEYLEKFKKVLPAEKIYKYQRAEEEFMKQMVEPRGQRGGRPGDQGSRDQKPPKD